MVFVHIIQATVPESKTEVTLTRGGLQQYRLGLEGRLEPGWAGRLSNGLAQRQINILRVAAARRSGRHWSSLIDLDFCSARVRPDAVDFLAISQGTPDLPLLPEPIMLNDYQLESSTRHEGTLYLEATGPDRIGFLSSLLNLFSFFSLFPVEILAETSKKQIFDRFWLKGMGGSKPSQEAVSALEERIRMLTHGATRK